VRGQLSGHTVVVLSTPDAPAAERDELLPLLAQAGATVTGSVRLRPGLLDPAKAAQLDQVVARAAPAGLVLPAGDPIDRAATQLAFALLRQSGQPEASAAATQVLGAYVSADLVDVDRPVTQRAELAIVLVGAAQTDPPTPTAAASATAQISALLSLASAFDAHSGGTVVAGPVTAADARGVLAPLRDDRQLSAAVGSVDSADEPQGQVAVVQALAQQLAGGSGRYGRGRAADSPVPTPRPS
jgi:Copper transport outer membrane protein, MctB